MRWRRAALVIGLPILVVGVALAFVEVVRGGGVVGVVRVGLGVAVFVALSSLALAARWSQLDARQGRREG